MLFSRLTFSLTALVLALALPAAAPAARKGPDLERHFEAAGATGTIVVRRSGPHTKTKTFVVDRARSRRRYLPSSTFKIPNSLLAIDRGVASGASQPYPGPNPNYEVDRKPLLPVQCEGDLTLQTAFAFSCIPIYQEIARELGRGTYERALKRMHYGDRDIDGAPLDEFWLRGDFGISAREQVRFLERLRRGRLGVSRRAIDEVTEMMVFDRADGSVVRGKTGYVFSTEPETGWWVGWVERGRRTWTFALNIDITRPEHFGARVSIGRAVLRDLGAFGR